MLGDVLAGIGGVGGVDTGRNASTQLNAVVGDEPLGGVEAENVHNVVRFGTNGCHGLGKALAVGVVLRPAPGHELGHGGLLAGRQALAAAGKCLVALVGQRRAVSELVDSVLRGGELGREDARVEG